MLSYGLLHHNLRHLRIQCKFSSWQMFQHLISFWGMVLQFRVKLSHVCVKLCQVSTTQLVLQFKLLQFNSIVLTKKTWDCLYGIVEQFTKVTKENAFHNTNYVILDTRWLGTRMVMLWRRPIDLYIDSIQTFSVGILKFIDEKKCWLKTARMHSP